MARKSLSELGVRALKPRAARYAYPDPELAGHFVRVQPSGAKSYCAVARNPAGKQIWTTIDSTDRMKIKMAREMAREIIRRVRDGLPAIEAKGETFGSVVEDWRKRHVQKNKLRSAYEINRLLDRHVLPVWRDREFVALRRSDITALLDRVEDNHGARQADYCLNIVRSIMNWHAARRDDYNPPVVRRGMRRQSPHAQRRARVLSDDEIRAIWKAADAAPPLGGIVQLCLLTAQRRSKVINLRRSEIAGDTWTLPLEAREKGNAGILVLPPMALAIIERQPVFAGNDFVFAGRDGPLIGVGKIKARLDQAAGVTGWTLHDLRRTARSLMSRAGVSSEHAERVMGHAIEGVEGTYDRHSYESEKADALKRLATLIEAIVHQRSADLVPMQRKGKRRKTDSAASP
jgi:integrase